MTSIISQNKLSDRDLQVTIKSHSGGILQDLRNSFGLQMLSSFTVELITCLMESHQKV